MENLIKATKSISLLFYSIFVASGLAHMLASWKVLSFPSMNDFIPSWPVSVTLLVVAHFFHAWNNMSFAAARTLLVMTFALVLTCEETGLRWGWLFSPYHFTSQLGWRLTDRLPALVLILWSCLVYPAMLLSNAILRGHPYIFPAKNALLSSAIIVGVLLTGFDVVSEPVQVQWGYHIWSHMLQNNTTCDSYVDAPDWKFASGLSSYFGVPLQNFMGWFISSFVIAYINYYLLLKHSGGVVKRPADKGIHALAWHWLPVIAAIHCVMCYYMLHACHPWSVRIGALIYVIVTALAAMHRCCFTSI